jgi:hypothetical protein
MADNNPVSKLVWQRHDNVIFIRPNGDEITIKKGNDLYIDYDNKHGHNGIYTCMATSIAVHVLPIGTDDYDWADFNAHIKNKDFVIRTDPADLPPAPLQLIDAWQANKEYSLGALVYVNNVYSVYYTCLEDGLTQDRFTEVYEEDYPYNSHNNDTGPERVISGIRNEGWYLYPRGSIADIVYVPKWPGMMYLCTDDNNHTLYAYTDGKGPVHGWWKYASADISPPLFVVGMIIGWLWSDLDPGTPLPVGFIKCDGSRISKTDYYKLYLIVQDKYK